MSSIDTVQIQQNITSAEAGLAAAKFPTERAKALQLVTAWKKAAQFAARRDRQAADGRDTSDAEAKIADAVALAGRIEAEPVRSWMNPAFTCK